MPDTEHVKHGHSTPKLKSVSNIGTRVDVWVHHIGFRALVLPPEPHSCLAWGTETVNSWMLRHSETGLELRAHGHSTSQFDCIIYYDYYGDV